MKKGEKRVAQEQRTVIIYGEILQITDSAVLIQCEGNEVWLPLSQMPDFTAEPGDTNVALIIPEWLAEEKGLDDGDGVPAQTEPVRDCSTCGNLPLEWETRTEDGRQRSFARHATSGHPTVLIVLSAQPSFQQILIPALNVSTIPVCLKT